MLLRRRGFLDGIVNDKIQEEVITTQDTADFTSTLKVNEQFLVHELQRRNKIMSHLLSES